MAEYLDLVALDDDPGGCVAVIRVSQLGLKTAVVEKRYWGDVCPDAGCILSKSLLKNAEVAHILNYEVKTSGIPGDVSFDFSATHARSREVSAGIVRGVHLLIKKSKTTEINSFGKFTGPTSVTITDGDGKGKETTFDKVITATSSVVCSLPDVEVGGNIVSYEEQTPSDEPSDPMAIVGADVIGMEFVYVLANYGVDVTIAEFMDNVLSNEDADASEAIAKEYKKLGVKPITGHKITPIVDNGDSTEVKVEAKDGGDEQTLTVDRAMVSIGFAPCTEGIGSGKAGAELGEYGETVTDECMCTNIDNIYAIGDITTKLQLTHVAEAQDVIAVEHVAGREAEIIPDYLMIPRATFCNPQVVSFGKTEAQVKKWAEESGRGIKAPTFPFSANGKTQGLAGPAGFVGLTADAEYGELLGGHVVGVNVSEFMP